MPRVQVPDRLKLPEPLLTKLTVPPGIVAPGEISVTLAVHMEGRPAGTDEGVHETEVDVACAVTVTATLVGAVVAPRGVPVTVKLYELAATEDATLTVKPLAAPVRVGVTGFTVKAPQVIPAGRVALTQDKVTI